ncbi:MAG: ABC transporter permease [Steroidobacteraceae bacterium]
MAILALEISISCVILANVIALSWDRFLAIRTSSGLQESQLLIARSTPDSVSTASSLPMDDALNVLPSQPDVQSASIVNQLPLSGHESWTVSISSDELPLDASGHAEVIQTSVYIGDSSSAKTLGLGLLSGRWFLDEEYATLSDMSLDGCRLAVLTEQLAKKLFPTGSAVGNTISINGQTMTVTGTLRSLSRPAYYGENRSQDAIFLPMRPTEPMSKLIAIRIKGGVDEASAAVRLEQTLNRDFIGRTQWSVLPYHEVRDRYFSVDKTAAEILIVILMAVIIAAANSIAGSTNYWILQRVHSLAIRRALGASISRITFSLAAENMTISMVGLITGIIIIRAIGTYLSSQYAFENIPVSSLISGSIAVITVAQASVFYLAWKLTRLSPAGLLRL